MIAPINISSVEYKSGIKQSLDPIKPSTENSNVDTVAKEKVSLLASNDTQSMEKVARIKMEIANGTFKINAGSIADKLLGSSIELLKK